MMTKYILNPGYVFSKNDGQGHYIDAPTLARLYGVSISDCVVRPEISDRRHHGWKEPEGALNLYPRSDGFYVIPGLKSLG